MLRKLDLNSGVCDLAQFLHLVGLYMSPKAPSAGNHWSKAIFLKSTIRGAESSSIIRCPESVVYG